MIEHYELLFIIPGSRDESEVPEIKEKVVQLLNKAEAQITLDKDWERRKLAYPIKHENHGHYWLIEFDADTSKIKELSHQLKLMSEILRSLIIKSRVKTAEELAEDVQIQAKIRAKKAEAVKEELNVEEKKAEQEKEPTPKLKPQEATESKVSMEDLDAKLEEILGDDLKV